MNQSLHTKSLAAVRVLRWIAYCGLIGACASSLVWSISSARSDGKGEGKSTGSTTASPNPPPPLPNQKGRLTSTGNGQKRTTYEYDALGRTIRTVHNFDGQSQPFTTAYGYPQNQVAVTGLGTVPLSQTFPDNEKVDYTYDTSDAEQSIKTSPSNGPQQTVISSILRNSRGQTIAATYGNGAISIYKYNEATNLRLNQIQTAAGGTLSIVGGVPQINGGTTLQNYGYSFDNIGNVTGITDSLNSTLSATYTYDSLDQLISMTPAGQALLAYTYDRIGNLTGKEGTAQTYYTGGLGHGPHALATSGALSYNYDNNGNLLSTSNGINTLTNITWNSENMPSKVVQGGTTMYQKFFVGESLWKKVEPSGTTYYLPSMRIENGQIRRFFAGFAERSPDGSLKFYHDDHLGSASLVTDALGNFIRRQAYMPYGADRSVSGTFTDAKYQFNFKEKESTGFYDYGARLYNPATGRWLSADPLTIDGLNRYSYVKNNPLVYKDATGRCSIPSGLGQGQIGICIEQFIAARLLNNGVGGINRFAFGDNRSFTALDGSQTARAHIELVFTPGKGVMDKFAATPGKSEVLLPNFTDTFLVMPTTRGGRVGTVDAEPRISFDPKTGKTVIFVGTVATNGFAGLGGPKDSITFEAKLTFDRKGKLIPGESKVLHTGYPSFEIYQYTPKQGAQVTTYPGNVRIDELYTFPERTVDYLDGMPGHVFSGTPAPKPYKSP